MTKDKTKQKTSHETDGKADLRKRSGIASSASQHLCAGKPMCTSAPIGALNIKATQEVTMIVKNCPMLVREKCIKLLYLICNRVLEDERIQYLINLRYY